MSVYPSAPPPVSGTTEHAAVAGESGHDTCDGDRAAATADELVDGLAAGAVPQVQPAGDDRRRPLVVVRHVVHGAAHLSAGSVGRLLLRAVLCRQHEDDAALLSYVPIGAGREEVHLLTESGVVESHLMCDDRSVIMWPNECVPRGDTTRTYRDGHTLTCHTAMMNATITSHRPHCHIQSVNAAVINECPLLFMGRCPC